jgi:hypothetical protein
MNFGVAGGLDGSALHLLAPIIEEHPEVSFDAEGKLHFAGGAYGGGLRLDVVKEYLAAAGELLAGNPSSPVL